MLRKLEVHNSSSSNHSRVPAPLSDLNEWITQRFMSYPYVVAIRIPIDNLLVGV